MRRLLLSCICLLFFYCMADAQQKFTLSGTVADSSTGESMIGVVVYIKGTNTGITTNVYGFYSLTLEPGTYKVAFSFIGYHPVEREILLKENIQLNMLLTQAITQMKEVVVTAEKDKEREQLHSTQMSAINIPVDKIKNIPTIGGETDIVKVMQLMPGVKRGGEGQNGMYVRGGNGDDNLILLDEAVVYNVSHLFGFFSVFNNDALKDVTLIKGGFPAQYGGRLSSVMDIRMKEGDMQKFHGEGGIGLLSSHLTVQGPIKKDTCSFIVSGRRSYIDQVFKLAYKGNNVLPYYFYDATAKINYKLSGKDRLYYSTYFGDDVLATKTGSDSSFFDGGFRLGNFTTTLRWNHVYGPKLFSNISLIATRFRYDVQAAVPGNSFLIRSKIQDIGAKADFSYYKDPDNNYKFGAVLVYHGFRPNVINTTGQISEFLQSKKGNFIDTEELSVYGSHEKAIQGIYKIQYGLRWSNLITSGTLYSGLEPRLAATWSISENQSLKFGYSRMKQYLHLVSNSSIALPTDLWYPVTRKVKPLSSDQLTLGYNYLFPKAKMTLSVEAYYKWMRNMIEYREGSVLILNDNYEDQLVTGKGKAYGFEFFTSRTSGKLTGWIGYTLSWSLRHFDELNKGKEFYAKYDRRHDVSFVASYDFTRRFAVSAVWVYSTGQRFTALTGNFLMPNVTLTKVDVLPIYSERNSIVLPASRRLDISFIFKTKQRKFLKYTGEWHFGFYNFFNRAQPYRVDVMWTDNGTYKYRARGLFGTIPFFAYHFKF